MSTQPNRLSGAEQPRLYQVRIRGQLGEEWSAWFGGLTITAADDGDTLCTGPVADQAALHGLLRKVRDLGMELVSVVPVANTGPARPEESRGECT